MLHWRMLGDTGKGNTGGEVPKKTTRKLSTRRLIGAVSMALLISLTTDAQTVGRQVVHGSIPAAARGLQPIERYPGTNQLNLAIGLPLRDPEALTSLLQQIYNPASPNYRHYLTPEEFTERFGPTEKDYQAVIAFAKASGFKVTAKHPNRMLVDVSASVSDIEKALHVKFQVFQHPTEKRLFHAPDTEPSLDLPVPVLGISGLDNYSLPRPQLHSTPLASTQVVGTNTGSGPGGTYMGKDFRAAYVPGTSLDGSGQVVGLLQFDGYTASDITYYESLAGLPSITLSNVLIDGFSGKPGGNELEVCLDIDMAISMATNLTEVVVYMAPNPSPWEDILNRMANDNIAKQLSCSWFTFGMSSNAVTDQIFQQMAAQGQSFFEASGDSDAFTGLIQFPCDSPYITQVGGTTLTTSGPRGSWVSETVWNRGFGTGSGGGISTQYPIPSWQTNIDMTSNQGSTTMRNTPDVALTAENVYVRANGVDLLVGGTSCAAPLWAGFVALVNQQAVASYAPTVGFINPAVAAIGAGTNYTADFHDITTGNNTSPSSPARFFAVTGYDLCTGWGTPSGQNLIDALIVPDSLALGITPTSGFNSIGPVGGPFSMTSQSFSLTNVWTDSLNWTLVNTSLWLNVSLGNGTLLPGGPAATVIVSLNLTASNLPVGNYSATIWFTNSDSLVAQSRQFALNVGLLPVITVESTNQAVAVAGGTATFSVAVSSIGPFSCQWQLNGTNLPDNIITTSAGNGSAGLSGDRGPASNASLDNPVGVAVDDAGNLFIADAGNSCIREIDSYYGIITTVAGNGSVGFSGDGGPAGNASFDNPVGVAVDDAGDLFIADAGNNRIRKVDSNGIITTVAGNGSAGFSGDGGSATNAACSYPVGVAVDDVGDLFIADAGNNRIREVDSNGTINTVAGNGTSGYSGDGGPAINAACSYPYGVAVDHTGDLFIADLGNSRIREVNTDGIITTVAGNGSVGFSGDGGPAANATFSYPVGVVVDDTNNLFIADSGNNRIREVDANGIVITVAGNGSAGYSGDGSMAANASLDNPMSVAVDDTGNLFIADSGDNRIRMVSSTVSPTLTLYNLTTNNVGNYAIVVTNAWGSITSSIAALTVVFPPVITSQPQSLTVTNGSAASFSVAASGAAPLSYQWQKNGVALTDSETFSGSATSNLVLSAATTNKVGNYTVIITNVWGSVTSSVATLAVAFPPVITSQPQNLTVTNGSPADFSVTVSGTAPLSYQWQKNGMDLTDGGGFSGSATSNLVLSATITNDAGNYTVIVTNTWGSVTSSVAGLAVVLQPAITSQPQSLIVANGSPASFSVTASGTASLRYQWQKNGVALIDGGTISGSATTNLVLSATTANDAGDYAVIVTNAWGSVTSIVATLTIALPPVIMRQPQSLTVTNGGSASFSVTASGTAPLDCQWQKNGVALIDGGTISGSTTTNLVLSATTTNDAGNYRVIVTDASGSITSSVAILTVAFPPVIVSQPQSLTVTNGSLASFSVVASGKAPLSYQWDKNGMALTNGGNLSGSATSNLVLSATTTNDAGNYSVVVTNASGSITSSVATLTVVFPPVITHQPQSLTVTNGSPASFSVTASGTALGYQWEKNGTALTDGGTLSGSATTNLVLSAATTNDAGNYTVIVTNTWGSVTSSVAILAVVLPPVITSQPQSLSVTNGSPASFNVTASGTAPIGYQWQKNGAGLTNGGTLSGSTTTNLVLSATTTNDAGNYSVIVTNASGSITSSVATLTVVFPPVIISQPQSLTVTNGSAASFSVVASGTAPLGYQWQKNGTALTDGGLLSGSATTNLMLSVTAAKDAGNYAVVVTNSWGSVTSSVAVLTVLSSPAITSQPQSLTVAKGSAASFSVVASGTSPLGYQWQKNGIDLTNGGTVSGSATTNLVLSNTATKDAGNYAVVVTNSWGSVTSSVATLTVVTSSPVITSQPQSLTVTNGSLASFSVTASGKGTLHYQWEKNGMALTNGGNLSGSATSNLVLSATTTNDAGNYSVVVTNASGSITSSVAALTVVFPPVITRQPQSLTVTNGSPASFSVTASGTALGYQWEKNGTALTDGGTLSGSATTNLVLSAATTNDAGNYTVIVTNTWGSVTSSVAILAVVLPPVITSQPQSLSVTNGSPASFNVTASGTAPIGYQWQKNGAGLTNGGTLSGSTTTNLVLSATTTNDAGNYSVIVTNASGSITSSVATLTVVFPPVIISQPQSLTMTNGSAASFSVVASGTAPLGYQWQKNGTALTDGGLLSGSATTNLVLSDTTTNDVGSYTVIITNIWGSVTSSVATLAVAFPPVITRQPQSLTVTNGSAADFSVAASGTPPLTYQWQKNGEALTDVGILSVSIITTNLLLSSATIDDAGNYTVVITNSWGSVTSSVATLTVVFPPVITRQPQSLTVTNGSAADFSVTVSGAAPQSYQWRKNGINLSDGGTVSGSATTNLVLSATTTNDAGNYAVIITNVWGSVTSSVAILTVVSAPVPPVIAQQPTNQIVAVVESSVSFSVTAGGTPPVSYQWNFNGTNISGATNTSLVLSNVQFGQSGTYEVLVTNLFGSILSSNAVLIVTPDHFSWVPVPSPRWVNTPFSVTIQARDMTNGILTNFTGTAYLDSTNGVAISPVVSSNFVQGSWTGTVLVAQMATNLVLRASDGFGHFGLASPINVVPFPALTLQVSSHTLQLLWPVSGSGIVLETSGSLSPAAWTVVSPSPIQLGNQYLVLVQISTNSFYRLQFIGP